MTPTKTTPDNDSSTSNPQTNVSDLYWVHVPFRVAWVFCAGLVFVGECLVAPFVVPGNPPQIQVAILVLGVLAAPVLGFLLTAFVRRRHYGRWV